MKSGNCESGAELKSGHSQKCSPYETQTLTERLEKSEAGRKKLRQAISILQEKLAASEKLLKANDNLQKECEQERQRAESEKKKAEEEKRQRAMLEKDSATVKDQLAKVLQRLGAVENKQKADKKEVERLRNEVKLSVEGMRVAAEAVDAVQSSLQCLETKLLEKVDTSFKEAHTATEAVHRLQSSFQNLENKVIKKGSLLDNQLPILSTNPASEKLVDEISRLFRKEKQSHCKIEQRLSKLKSFLTQDRLGNSVMTAKNLDLENLAFLTMEEEKVSKKRKPRGKEELLNWKARKRSKFYDVDVVNSVANRSRADAAKEANESMSSPFSMGYQMTSEEPPRVPNTASNEYIGEAIVSHRGTSGGKVHMQIPPVGGKAQKESQESLFAQREDIDSGVDDVLKGCVNSTCLQSGGNPEVQCEDVFEVMQDRSLDQLAGQGGAHGSGLDEGRSMADVPHINNASDASDLDLNFNDSDDEWWSNRVLLSPSLPDIPSPVHHSPFCSREPSFSKTIAHTADATLDLGLHSSAILDVSVSDSHVLTEAATSMTNTQGAGMQRGGNPDTVCLKQLAVSSQKNISVSSSSSQPGSHLRVEEQQNKVESGVNLQFGDADKHTEMGSKGVQQSVQCSQVAGLTASESSARETKSSFYKPCSSLDPLSATKAWTENFISSDKQETEKEFQLNDEFGFEAVDIVSIAEIDKFLEVLPPMPLAFANESCASDLLQVNCADAKPCEVIDEGCTSAQSQAACEMLTLKAVNMNDSRTADCSCEISCNGLQQITNLSQNTHAQDLPIQDKPDTFKATGIREAHSVLESSNMSDHQAVLISSTKPSSSSVVLLLQAFDLQGVDTELNVIAACIMAINFKGYLQATSAEKEEIQLQGATLSRASACVPIEYLACSFISVVVDVVRFGNGKEEHCNFKAEPIFVVVHNLVAFIRSMFKDKANIILNTTFSQLGRFLVQGEAMLMTLYGSLGPYEDVLSFAQVFQEKKHHSHRYSEATLEDIYAGGKVLAALCQILSCVTHLQNVVYEVLGWCDKDVMWLLTVFSSFSSICGNSAFMVETDDILGHAICTIILELVASVEQDSIKTAEGINSKAISASSHLPLGLSTLKGSLEVNGNMSVEQVLLAVFEAFRYIFSSAHNSLAVAFVENKRFCSKECCNNDTKPWQASDFSGEENLKNPVPCQKVSVVCETLQHWQKKYGEAVGALQLIAHFMGWEWAYNQLIIRCLWREAAVSGSSQLCVAVIVHILSMLWRMGMRGGGTNLPGLAELKKCLVHVVNSTSLSREKFEHHLSLEEGPSEGR